MYRQGTAHTLHFLLLPQTYRADISDSQIRRSNPQPRRMSPQDMPYILAHQVYRNTNPLDKAYKWLIPPPRRKIPPRTAYNQRRSRSPSSTMRCPLDKLYIAPNLPDPRTSRRDTAHTPCFRCLQLSFPQLPRRKSQRNTERTPRRSGLQFESETYRPDKLYIFLPRFRLGKTRRHSLDTDHRLPQIFQLGKLCILSPSQP